MSAEPTPERRMSARNPALATAVGDVATAGAFLEQAVADLLSVLLGNSRGANAITAGLSFDQLVQSSNAVLNQATPRPFIDRVRKALAEAKTAWQERSNIVHARWSLPVGDGHEYGFRERRWSPAITTYVWTLDEIGAVADQLDAAMLQIGSLTAELITAGGGAGASPPGGAN